MPSLRSFNSKLVRLKDLRCGDVNRFAKKFQFQTGSIKSDVSSTEKIGALRFQFQTGSIKRLHGASLIQSDVEFQFQTGSIKRSSHPIIQSSSFMFQFQTGSIKRLYENHIYIIQDPYGTCQVNFYACHFQGGFAVDLQ